MAATSTTRFVVCGAGSIGREYALRHLTSENGARVVAIVDPSAQAAADLAQAAASQQAAGASAVVGSKYREQVIGGEGAQPLPTYSMLQDALKSMPQQIDAVYIGTPPSTHAEITGFAIAASKHVLLEKPLGATSADADAIVRLAESAPDCVCGMNIGMRYNRAVHVLREKIQARTLGEIHEVDIRLHFREWPREWQKQPWVAKRVQGGALREVGTHYFFGLLEVFGHGAIRRVKTEVVYPSSGDGDGDEAEVSCTGVLEMEGGLQVHLDVQTKCNHLSSDVYEMQVTGAQQSLLLHDFTALREVGGAGTVLVDNGGYGRAECVQELCQDIVAGSARTESQGVTVQQGRGVCLLLDAILASGGEWAAVDCVGGVADARNGSGGGGGGL